MRPDHWRRFLLFPVGYTVAAIAFLLSASYLILPARIPVTCRATFTISEGQCLEQTFMHLYPGHMSELDAGQRSLLSAFVGILVGLPSGVVLSFFAKSARLRRAAILGLAIGSCVEYVLQSLLLLMLNSHHSEQTGPFMSYEAPLVGFNISVWPPLDAILNGCCFLLMHTAKPLGESGTFVLLLIPAITAFVALHVAKMLGRRSGLPLTNGT